MTDPPITVFVLSVSYRKHSLGEAGCAGVFSTRRQAELAAVGYVGKEYLGEYSDVDEGFFCSADETYRLEEVVVDKIKSGLT